MPKTTTKSAKLEVIKAFFFSPPFARPRERTCMKMQSTVSRFVIGQLNVLAAGVYARTFHPGQFTGSCSEGVNAFNAVRELSVCSFYLFLCFCLFYFFVFVLLSGFLGGHTLFSVVSLFMEDGCNHARTLSPLTYAPYNNI